jgi:hypothetical protein
MNHARRWRLIFFGIFAAASLGAVLLPKPIPQNPGYHRFDHARAFLEIPNFLNVASKLPFFSGRTGRAL